MRYVVKKGTKGWLVWDKTTATVAIFDGKPAMALSAETANHFARTLNASHSLDR